MWLLVAGLRKHEQLQYKLDWNWSEESIPPRSLCGSFKGVCIFPRFRGKVLLVGRKRRSRKKLNIISSEMKLINFYLFCFFSIPGGLWIPFVWDVRRIVMGIHGLITVQRVLPLPPVFLAGHAPGIARFTNGTYLHIILILIRHHYKTCWLDGARESV